MTRHSIPKLAASLFALVLTVATTAPAAHAQDLKTVVNIPFAFELGSHHFEAGKYTINSSLEGRAINLQNGSNSGVTLTMWDSNSKPSTGSKVVFHRYGNRYFLREVWTEGEDNHLKCVDDRAEKRTQKEIRSQIAASAAEATTVDVAVLTKPY
jgi:hypothetical protein